MDCFKHKKHHRKGTSHVKYNTINIPEISHMNMNIYCEPVGVGVNTVVASVSR